jgi:hypothetical protein
MWNLGGLDCYFVTLTYPELYAEDWRVWKRDLEAFLKRIQRKYDYMVGCCWRVEFQKRGAPHFHLIMVADKSICTCGGGVKRIVKGNHGTREVYMHRPGCGMGLFRSEIASMWPDIVREGYSTTGADMGSYSASYEKHKRAGTGVEALTGGRRQLMAYVSKYLAKVDQTNAPDEWGRNWGFRDINGELDFSPVETINLDYKQAVLLRRLVKRWLKSRGKGKYAKFLSMRVNYSVLGLGADSDSGRALYRMLGGVSKGLFAPHILPGSPGGALEARPFIERVALGLVKVDRPALKVGMQVQTPRGLAELTSVVQCPILKRARVSVLLAERKNADGSRFAAFDLAEVRPVVAAKAAVQAALW